MQMPDLSQIDISQLPHSLQALIDCIGIENAYQLTCAYGGRPKYIPKHRERTKLADVLPAEALDALIKRFAGVALEIPKACLLYTSPSPRDQRGSRMPSSA